MAFALFMKWGLDFIGLIKPTTRYTKNQYIIFANGYTTKWVEMKTFCYNMAKSTAKFIYEQIVACFGYLTHLISDQGSHFINKTIEILVEEL
jgi:hypothetical protein